MFFQRVKSDTKESPINGTIRLGKSFGKLALITNGIPQSGGEFITMWQKVTQYIVLACPKAKTCLMLGVAGGTAITTLREKYPKLTITGIELDQTIITVAQQHFGLIADTRTRFVIADAKTWVSSQAAGSQYDIIIVDLYIGDRNPTFVKTVAFLKSIRKLRKSEGVIVINADYQKKHAALFNHFVRLCYKYFPVVEDVFAFPKNHILILR